jgi:Zn finger protein HypA/HybF involved in hydrogenase expression
MHDLHAADKLVRTIKDYARKNGLKKISKVKIELGKITEHGEEIRPDNLKYNIKILGKGLIASGAKIEVKRISGPYLRLKEIEGTK